jgi:hypothetical protein
MASLDDLLTASKNIVVALNASNNFAKLGFAQSSKLNITASTLVASNAGRLYTVLVTTAGSTAGSLYDAANTSSVAASNLIANIPATVGAVDFNWPFQNGLVFVPGSGMVANIAYT